MLRTLSRKWQAEGLSVGRSPHSLIPELLGEHWLFLLLSLLFSSLFLLIIGIYIKTKGGGTKLQFV